MTVKRRVKTGEMGRRSVRQTPSGITLGVRQRREEAEEDEEAAEELDKVSMSGTWPNGA